jgi:hypothetical protein
MDTDDHGNAEDMDRFAAIVRDEEWVHAGFGLSGFVCKR